MTIPSWIPADAWAGYIEMRKKIKKVMTPRAEAMQIKTLEEFRDAGYDVAEILDNSTMNNWTSLYQPKEKVGAAKGKLPQLGKQGQSTADNAQQWLNDHAMDDSLEQKRRFASLITGMADYYKAEISRTALSIYWEGLRQYSYEAIEKACWAHTQLADEAGRWMPRNADIIKMIEGGTLDRSMLAWSKVDNAVRVRGTWDDVVFDDAIIHRVIADMGGWVLVGGKDDKEWPFIGKEFQQRYRSYTQRGATLEYPAQLTGIANAQNSSAGRPLLPPILIGDEEKAKQVLKNSTGAPALGLQRAQIASQPT